MCPVYTATDSSEGRLAIAKSFLADPQYAARLEGLVSEMYGGQEMSFADCMGVIRAAIGAKSWSLVEEYGATAALRATPEAYAE